MYTNYYFLSPEGELYHHGIKGQKWGQRRFQNADGTLTAAGKKRISNRQIRKDRKELSEKFEKNDNKYKAADALVKKYDKERVDRFNKRENVITGRRRIGLMLAASAYGTFNAIVLFKTAGQLFKDISSVINN